MAFLRFFAILYSRMAIHCVNNCDVMALVGHMMFNTSRGCLITCTVYLSYACVYTVQERYLLCLINKGDVRWRVLQGE